MLPCFDEPNFKATFQVSIIRSVHLFSNSHLSDALTCQKVGRNYVNIFRNANHIARSNMNLLMSKEYKDGLIKDEFEKSVKMSTYLLAVAVLDGYGYIRKLTRNTTTPIEVRLYAPEDMLVGQAEFGLDTTIRALEFFEHYFNISYPLDKIGMVIVELCRSNTLLFQISLPSTTSVKVPWKTGDSSHSVTLLYYLTNEKRVLLQKNTLHSSFVTKSLINGSVI